MALTTSRPWVSLDRQAVAPKESIWLHSAAVGRLASTTRRVVGNDWCSWNTCAGLVSEPKLSTATSGSCVSIARSIADGSTRVGEDLEVRVLGDQMAEPDRDQILELGHHDADWGAHVPQCRGEGGGRQITLSPHPSPPPKITRAEGKKLNGRLGTIQ